MKEMIDVLGVAEIVKRNGQMVNELDSGSNGPATDIRGLAGNFLIVDPRHDNSLSQCGYLYPRKFRTLPDLQVLESNL